MRQRFHPGDGRGQALVELALVLPILSLLLLGMIQFGVVFNHYITLTDAVRAGARTGSVGRQVQDPVAAVEQSVRNAATDNLDPEDLEISVESAWAQGSKVTVTASYPYEIRLLGFGVTVTSGRLSSSTTERVE
jgi:Flp pilus assembly protein TadG